MTVLVAGGGIGGLAMALTCQQIGVDVKVFESAAELRPLGVGINLQPNAVRELYDLGLGDKLPTVGIETTEWALVGKNGNDIWSEPRGIGAGYNWPQFSVHRGKLQMMLYNAFVERAGHTAVLTDHRLTDYENRHDGVKATFTRRNGSRIDIDGDLLIGADGLHSATRAKMYPDEGAPIWGGAVVWRGT
ncbi:MAG: FAD-dependent monooxygenase, partial [Actinomycetota bacterium]|nr:FAD-dependent monooxygenase [Actinomycetota bacterium]